jgi:hypothetical protein
MSNTPTEKPVAEGNEVKSATADKVAASPATDGATGESPAAKEKKSQRDQLLSKQKAVLDFLLDCDMYEADAVRVLLSCAFGKYPDHNLPGSEVQAVNQFLNAGIEKSGVTSYGDAINYRSTRREKLDNTLLDFLSKGQLNVVNRLLNKIVYDPKNVEQVLRGVNHKN